MNQKLKVFLVERCGLSRGHSIGYVDEELEPTDVGGKKPRCLYWEMDVTSSYSIPRGPKVSVACLSNISSFCVCLQTQKALSYPTVVYYTSMNAKLLEHWVLIKNCDEKTQLPGV
jgi:hypothetical protein